MNDIKDDRLASADDVKSIVDQPTSNQDQWPKPDSSYGWLIVVASFLMQACSFGVATSFGIFVDHYNRVFIDSGYEYISLIGTVAPTTLAFISMFTGRFCDRFGFRLCAFLGAIIIAISYVLASFSTEIWQLIICQGFIFGVGGALIYVPANSVVVQWFEKYRGLAVGIGTSGSGIGGVIFSLVNAKLLESVEYQWTLRYNAIICFVLLSISALVIKPRIPISKSESHQSKLNWKSLIQIRFGFFLLAMLFASLGYLVPLYYVPTYTTSIGYSVNDAAVLLAIINGMSAGGRIVLGIASDYLGHLNMFIACLGLSSLFLVIWRFATNYTILLVFAVLFGFPNGGFAGGFATACAELFGTENLSTILGIAYAPTGFGDLAGPSLAGVIFNKTHSFHNLIYYAIAMSGISFTFLLIIKLFTKNNSQNQTTA